MFELTITLKGEEQSYKQKFIVYVEVTLSVDDPTIRSYIDEAKKRCNFEIEECKVRCNMIVPLELNHKESA